MSRHEPASQEDASDAPTVGQIYVGLGWSKDIIVQACRELHTIEPRLAIAGEDLKDAHDTHRMVGVKLASESAYTVATEIEALAKKIRGQAASLARASCEHLNRRPRI